MERLMIQASERERVGKEYAKKARRQGLVLSVLYKKGVSMPLELKEIDLIHLLHRAHSESMLVDLKIIKCDGKEEVNIAILKDLSHDPLKGNVLHVDFQGISLDEIIKIKIPVEVKGEPIGVKRDEGVLDHLLWEIEVECKAAQIPEKIEIDVSDLAIGDAIHISDLKFSEGVKATGAMNQIVVHVSAPRVEVEEEVAAVTEEIQEPEVIREKKEVKEEETKEEGKKEGKKEGK